LIPEQVEDDTIREDDTRGTYLRNRSGFTLTPFS
jgi:hypothetical protein